MTTPFPSRVIVANDWAEINGGQSKVAIRSARMLADAGHEVVFFAPCGPVDPLLNGIRTICLNQKDILSDPARGATRGIWNLAAAKALASICHESNPRDSILHCHGYAKALSPSIGPLLANRRFPSVFTMHEYFLACPNGGFFDFQRSEICHRRPLGLACLTTNCDVRHPTHKVWRVARQVVSKTAGHLPSGLRDVIYISGIQRDVMRPHLAPHVRLHHVPNPTAVSAAPVAAAMNDVFLFVGRLSPEKGCRLFAEAARLAGVRAVFAGDGQERAAIERINPDALITGWLTGDEVQNWIDRARCLVFPSLWYECQPLAPMEALSRRVPVICGNWGAAREVVEHGATGLHIERPTAEDLAGALVALKGDHMVFQSIGKRAPLLTSDADHLARLREVYASVVEAICHVPSATAARRTAG